MLAMMNFMTPTDAGPLGVLLFFTTLYVVMFTLATILVAAFFKIKKKTKLGVRGYEYAAILGLAPVMLLVMRSFIGFSMLSLALTAAFEVIGCFLIKANKQA